MLVYVVVAYDPSDNESKNMCGFLNEDDAKEHIDEIKAKLEEHSADNGFVYSIEVLYVQG